MICLYPCICIKNGIHSQLTNKERWKKITLAFSVHRSQTQVIIEHSYIGPMCLQFTNPPSVVDVKSEIMEKTGLSIKDQDIYCNGKKVI